MLPLRTCLAAALMRSACCPSTQYESTFWPLSRVALICWSPSVKVMVFTSPLSMCSDILEVSISWYPPFEANSCSATSTPTTATTIQNHGPRMKRFTVVTSGAQPPTSSDSTSGVRTPQRRTQTVHGRGEQGSESRITTGHAQVTLKIPARIRAGSRVDGRSECAHAAQVAVALVVVQAVAH